MSSYLTNAQLRGLGVTAIPAGFELVMDGRGGLRVKFWGGFYRAGHIVDRVDGRRARQQTVAVITPSGRGYAYTTTPGSRGAIRHGWAKTEDEAIACVSKWLKRRFAHVTPAVPPSGRF